MEPITCHAGDRLLVFAPHPDDESLACGGLIQRAQAVGARVRVVFATDGDANPWPQRVIERRWRLGPDATRRWAARRGSEARAALKVLGVHEDDARFLHWSDQGLTARLMAHGEESVQQLRQLIRETRPTMVAMPSILDSHPDHSALALMLKAALRGEASNARLLAYWLHGRSDAARGGVAEFALQPHELAGKRLAALAHDSQTKFGTSRLLRFVAAREQFRQPVATVPSLQDSTLQDGWRWSFRSRGVLGVAAARRVRIVGIAADGTLRAASLDLREAVSSGQLRILRRGRRGLELAMAPLWPGAWWVVAKLDTNHRINVYDEFAWLPPEQREAALVPMASAMAPSSPCATAEPAAALLHTHGAGGSGRD